MIRVEKTRYSDQWDQRIWHVRRQFILGIWVMILPGLALVEVSTVAWNDWIKNNFESVIGTSDVAYRGEHLGDKHILKTLSAKIISKLKQLGSKML